MSSHTGTRITNVSKNTPIYVTFGNYDSVPPSSPELEPLSKESTNTPQKLALTPLLPEKTLVYDPQPQNGNYRGGTFVKPAVVKMYIWSIPQSEPIANSKLLWQGYVVASVTKPIVVDPDEKSVVYNGTSVPNLENSTLIERFQHYQEGSCMNGAGGIWTWVLAGILLLVVLLAIFLSPS